MSDTAVDRGREGERIGSDGERDSSSGSSRAPKVAEGRIVRGTRPHDIERKNWLIHLHYIKKDFETCKVLIGEMLQETEGMCEYAIYVLGLIKRQEGEISDSLELFQRAVTLAPNNPAAIKQVARSLFLLGRHKTALETYSEALTICPQEWEILHNMGVCYIYLKDYEKAEEKLREAVKLSPQTNSFVQLGRTHLLRGGLEKAVDVYKTAIEHNPDSPDLLTTLGLLYMELGETKKAFEALGSALTFNPSNARAILAAGAMIQEHGDYDVALSKYRVAAAATPESAQLWNNIGMCLFGKGKHVAAISCLKRATYLSPFEWKILHNLGLVHLSLHHYSSGYHFLRGAVGLNPNSGQLFMLLGVALGHLNDHENACKSYEQALTLDRENPLIHLNYAILLHNNGEMRAAAKQLQLFKSKSQTHTPSNTDPEIEAVVGRLGPALQVGDRRERREKGERDGRQKREGRGVLWEEQDEAADLDQREKRLTSWF